MSSLTIIDQEFILNGAPVAARIYGGPNPARRVHGGRVGTARARTDGGAAIGTRQSLPFGDGFSGWLCARRALYCIAFLLCLGGGIAGAQSPIFSTEASPTSVVQEYCGLDLKGARLSGQNALNDKISALVTWRIEPGWDTVVVVRAFEVVGTSLGPTKSSVTVRYSLLGNMFGAKVTAAQQHTKLVTFLLTKSPGGWRIASPLIAPHVSVAAAISALNSLLADEKDPEQMRQLHAGINALTKWKRGTESSKEP